MKQFAANIEIDGTPEQVWKVLTDASAYSEWDPNMNSIEGTIGLGEKLVLHTTLSKRPFTVTVSTFDQNERMVWKSGMPLGLFKGERTFQITERDGKVHFALNEVFSGLMSPIIGRMIPDLQPTFEKFVAGLKAEVEGGSGTEGDAGKQASE